MMAKSRNNMNCTRSEKGAIEALLERVNLFDNC